MNNVEIIDQSGTKLNVYGIYYISNNNYYFIYSKQEQDNEGHTVLYICKVLQEALNTPTGQIPTGYLIGLKIDDENEYNIVKADIVNIIDEKQNNKKPSVRYLDISMLKNFKVKDCRVFKLETSIFKRLIDMQSASIVQNETPSEENYKIKYEEEVTKNNLLRQTINELNNKLESIKQILN